MNPIIKRELEKVRAQLPEYDDSTTLIRIPRWEPLPDEKPLEVGGIYLIEIADYVLNEPPNFTLSANWNKGVIPTSNQLSVQVKKTAGKMVQLDATGYDPDLRRLKEDFYQDLWLPTASITILDQYKG